MSIYGINPSGGGSVNSYQYIAINGQTEFPLEITLKISSLIFVNGAAIAASEYSGIETETLILNSASFFGDVIKIIE